MMRRAAIAIMVLIALAGCKKNDPVPKAQELLLGTWVSTAQSYLDDPVAPSYMVDGMYEYCFDADSVRCTWLYINDRYSSTFAYSLKGNTLTIGTEKHYLTHISEERLVWEDRHEDGLVDKWRFVRG